MKSNTKGSVPDIKEELNKPEYDLTTGQVKQLVRLFKKLSPPLPSVPLTREQREAKTYPSLHDLKSPFVVEKKKDVVWCDCPRCNPAPLPQEEEREDFYGESEAEIDIKAEIERTKALAKYLDSKLERECKCANNLEGCLNCANDDHSIPHCGVACRRIDCNVCTSPGSFTKSVPVPRLPDRLDMQYSLDMYDLGGKINQIISYLESWRKG